MRVFWHRYRTELENFRIEAHELLDAGDDVVLIGQFRWRGPASGIVTESPLGIVLTIRAGKIVKSMDYLSHEEALEAAGLANSHP